MRSPILAILLVCGLGCSAQALDCGMSNRARLPHFFESALSRGDFFVEGWVEKVTFVDRKSDSDFIGILIRLKPLRYLGDTGSIYNNVVDARIDIYYDYWIDDSVVEIALDLNRMINRIETTFWFLTIPKVKDIFGESLFVAGGKSCRQMTISGIVRGNPDFIRKLGWTDINIANNRQ
jgi:hypothetical protein